MALNAPARPDHAPTARPRSSGVKLAESRARLPGTSRAPPMPWTARARISRPRVGASPHKAEAALKATSPTSNSRRRP
jgi:hypothetical protein